VGADWHSQGGFHLWDTVPGSVQVRLAPGQTVGEGCKYPVSLAEYTTEGPNWYVSGHQSLVDKATVHLTGTYHLIAAWNGGEQPCAPGASNSPTPTPSESTPSPPPRLTPSWRKAARRLRLRVQVVSGRTS
jgi:hypothetical protein